MDRNLEKEELEKAIKYYNYKYWVEFDSDISDEEYDKLVMRLKEMDIENKLLDEIKSPIGEVSEKRQKIQHKNRMLSLNKAYTLEEVLKFVKDTKRSDDELYQIQPKYDGISGVFYNQSLLATRGSDGIDGIDISDKIKNLKIFSNNYQRNENFPIYGEIIIQEKEFEEKVKGKIRRKSGEEFSTSRNFVAGFINQLITTEEMGKIKIDFIDYSSFYIPIKASEILQNFINIAERLKLNLQYKIDGIVIKLDDIEYAKSLGSTEHHPRSAIAYKFQSEAKATVLQDIEIDIGKTSKASFTAIFSPVEIGGVKITRATLHNYKFILDNDIQLNDNLIIERSGDVIPKIIGTSKGSNRKEKLFICPFCKTSLVYIEPEMFCRNPKCTRKYVKKLLYSIKKIGLDDMGISIAEDLFEKFGIYRLSDLMEITFDQLMSLDGIKEKSSNNILSHISKLKETPIEDWKVLSSLDIDEFGTSASKEMMRIYNISELFDKTEEDFKKINNVGPVLAKKLFDGLKQERETLLYMIKNMASIINTKNSNSEVENRNKIKICFTGKFPNPKTYYYKMLNFRDFEIVENITKDTNILVVYNRSIISEKMKKAEKLKIRIIDLNEFQSEIIQNQ